MLNKENSFNLFVGYNVFRFIIRRGELMFRFLYNCNKRGRDLWVGIMD